MRLIGLWQVDGHLLTGRISAEQALIIGWLYGAGIAVLWGADPG